MSTIWIGFCLLKRNEYGEHRYSVNESSLKYNENKYDPPNQREIITKTFLCVTYGFKTPNQYCGVHSGSREECALSGL